MYKITIKELKKILEECDLPEDSEVFVETNTKTENPKITINKNTERETDFDSIWSVNKIGEKSLGIYINY